MVKKILLILIAAVLVLFLYVAIGRKDLTLSKSYVKEKYKVSNSHFLNWNGTEIHYTEAGSGFPVLMIHGFGGNNRDFVLLDSLINPEYRVIRVDLPGFGLSDFPDIKEEDPDFIKIYGEYFNFLMDTLHLDSFYVIGNSLGGLMAWNLTVEHPGKVKKLVLFNSAGYDMKEVIKSANAKVFKYGLVKLLLKNGIPVFMTKRGISRVFYDKSLLTPERLTRVNELWNREGNLPHIMRMASSAKYLDQSLIKRITCPTLIVWGKQDKIVSPKYADRFHEDIKGSRLIVYDSCGHVPMMEKPLEVKRDVLDFFQH
ncbi:MAG: alpha/beta hydrolase [Sphingobacteriales bacterium]|nr:alpha/beta hydrolase [Sphingobacteriales bacterium]